MKWGNIGGWGLNFLMTLYHFSHKVEASLCSSGNIKKDGMYVGYKEIGGGGINGNGEVQDGKHGMRIPTKIPKILL